MLFCLIFNVFVYLQNKDSNVTGSLGFSSFFLHSNLPETRNIHLAIVFQVVQQRNEWLTNETEAPSAQAGVEVESYVSEQREQRVYRR